MASTGNRTGRALALSFLLAASTLVSAAPASASTETLTANNNVDTCGAVNGLELAVIIGGQQLCTHGDDTQFEAGHDHATHDHDDVEVVQTEGVAGVRGTGPLPTITPSCIGSGNDGPRVEVLVVDVEGGKGVKDSNVRRWAGQVDWTFVESARRDGSERRVRWVTEATNEGCQIKVEHLTVAPEALESFSTLIRTVAALGKSASGRKYLMYVDADMGRCGMATSTIDDKPVGNVADLVVGYARVDRPCWDAADDGPYSVAAHELTHTFGAVQPGAPNASGNNHCNDEWDLMCYADGDDVQVTVVCEDDETSTKGSADRNNALLDCNGDDYFNAGTTTGWLATHWNVANSAFLAASDLTITTQRKDKGNRKALHLAAKSDKPIDVALDVATWLGERNGANWANTVVVCRDDVHADCLAGSGLVGTDGLTLFVPGGRNGTLPTSVRNALTNAAAADATVYVLGGPGAVAPAIEDALLAAVPATVTVTRLSGTSRFMTATVVADEVIARAPAGTTPRILLARSDDPIDAVAVGALAARKGLPLVLTNPNDLPADTATWLAAHRSEVVGIGGPKAISEDVLASVGQLTRIKAVRVSGPDRFSTSVAVATDERLWGTERYAGDRAHIFVNGRNAATWAVALASSSVAATMNAPVLYVDSVVPTVLAEHLASLASTTAGDVTGIAVGGPSLLDPTVALAALSAVAPGFDGNHSAI